MPQQCFICYVTITIFPFRLYLQVLEPYTILKALSQTVSHSETLDCPLCKAGQSTGALMSYDIVIKDLRSTVHYSQNYMTGLNR